ncbi:SNF1 protein kinase subunit beta-3 [Pseudocercospora fuligena]|uniref:SNF1 protein kinase subunit beta-3 n=1 Tax=Pseudocercospora fuligena TaxID=685502 RepID=A0A8H6VFW6_9PEZI|nr:SNF1 protein kinase subunit beta-3 [Pseudocercospora fuligena]
MGNSESSEAKPEPIRPPSRSQTLPIRSSTPAAQEAPPTQESQSHAVDVPQQISSSRDGVAETNEQDDYIPAGYSSTPYGVPPSDYTRPPRLPLPIEEEVHTPGSPIITPQDITSPLDSSDIDGGALPRKASVLSSTTVDDEDVGDNDAFAQESTHSLQVRVPTKLGWYGSGDKVFVTGTFCNWERKIKLPRIKDAKDGKDGFCATIALPPGTHHIKFLVDGEMVTSSDLPTTVDWTNILVNYIEVVAPLPPATEDAKQAPVPAEPMPIPGAAITAGQATGTGEPAARPHPNLPASETTDDDVSSTLKETVDGKIEKPATPATASIPIPQQTPTPRQQTDKADDKNKKAAAQKKQLPRPKYTNQIPDFLIDLDNFHNPEDERFQRANRVAANLPQPPSLPMFLSKSILNGTTPHKDDASVLIMPNHTVLNHLATSSIKSGVLATSGTTRYKRKVRKSATGV